MTQNQGNTCPPGQGEQNKGNQYQGQQPGSPGQKTGPSTGNARGNDMPSEGGMQTDVRGAQGTQTKPGQQQTQPGRKTDDESGGENKASGPGRAAQAKTGQPNDTSEETAGKSANQDAE